MNINIIGVPVFYGADRKGPEFGPAKLREKKLSTVLSKHGHVVYDMGNLHIPEVKEYNKFYAHDNMKYLDAIVEINTNLAHSVYAALQTGSFPLTIGGDHSVGLGSISGVSKASDNFAVIWMDAHGDINTHDTSESGNIHGMPLAKVMGFGYEELRNVYFDGRKVSPENVFIVGARDLDLGELELIQSKKLNVFTAEDIREFGIEVIFEKINSQLTARNIEHIHLSFDLDFIDAQFVPGTGTPVENGPSVEETRNMLRSIATTGKLKSMDFVELNVLLDRNDMTSNLAIDLLDWTFRHL
jgi:arginase